MINRLLLVSLMSKMFMNIPIRGGKQEDCNYSIYKLIILCIVVNDTRRELTRKKRRDDT